jgi:hypothetical protein
MLKTLLKDLCTGCIKYVDAEIQPVHKSFNKVFNIKNCVLILLH